MNIFLLDNDLHKNAEYYCDKNWGVICGNI